MEPAYVWGTSLGGRDLGHRWDAAPLSAGEPMKLRPPRPLAGGALKEEVPPQPQTLVRTVAPDSGALQVRWTVDARKLRCRDKIAVSPPFALDSPPGTFRLMLCPKAVSDRKGGASFQKAKGRGFVQVKCEAALGEAARGAMSLRVAVGGPGGAAPEPRGPLRHDFAQCGVCCDQEEWNFTRAVDEATQTFVVTLELLTEEAGPPGLQV